ncbi:hypothetical protein FGB62_261g012 [Gracilaria domingensis]|nr:hypothetical protein FGB62_261g012 [Gracilaria domingensis]
MEIPKEENSDLVQNGRDGVDPPLIDEDSVGVDEVVEQSGEQHQSPAPKDLMFDQPPKVVPSLSDEGAEPVHITDARMRCEANAEGKFKRHPFVLCYRLALRTVPNRERSKDAGGHSRRNSIVPEVRKFGEKQKELLQKYAERHGALISKAMNVARELKVKLAYRQKQL